MKLLLLSLALLGVTLVQATNFNSGCSCNCIGRCIEKCNDGVEREVSSCGGKREAWPFGRREAVEKREVSRSCNCNTNNGVGTGNLPLGDCIECIDGNCNEVSSCNGKREAQREPLNSRERGSSFPTFTGLKREAVEKRAAEGVTTCSCNKGSHNGNRYGGCEKCVDGNCFEVSSCGVKREAVKKFVEKREAENSHSCNCNIYNGVGSCIECFNGNCNPVSSCNGKREAYPPGVSVQSDTGVSSSSSDEVFIDKREAVKEVAVEKRDSRSCNCNIKNGVGSCIECINGSCNPVSTC